MTFETVITQATVCFFLETFQSFSIQCKKHFGFYCYFLVKWLPIYNVKIKALTCISRFFKYTNSRIPNIVNLVGFWRITFCLILRRLLLKAKQVYKLSSTHILWQISVHCFIFGFNSIWYGLLTGHTCTQFVVTVD